MKLFLLLAAVLLTACTNNTTEVEIATRFGTMRATLFDDTPEHRDNFLRLADAHAYDSLLFHRVIRGFMIQGGDPESRNATRSTPLGQSEIGDPLPAEICFPQHFHKRGALAAARKPDSVNPERLSSGSQFYIVHGSIYQNETLDEIEQINNKALKNKVFYEIQPFYTDSLRYYQEHGMFIELSNLQLHIMQRVTDMAEQRGLFSFPDSVRQFYTTQGGAPSLDGNYTVFGQITSGFDVLDSIANQMISLPSNRPVDDIRMTVRRVKN